MVLLDVPTGWRFVMRGTPVLRFVMRGTPVLLYGALEGSLTHARVTRRLEQALESC